MESAPTVSLILDAAQQLVQTRGYNAFSYRDLAERVGIRTASIHYHFPTKTDLGRALIRRYRSALGDAFARWDREHRGPAAASKKLRQYGTFLESVLRDGDRMCLGGMLAADFATLPAEIQGEVALFVRENEQWLARVLAEGRDSGELHFTGNSDVAAAALFAALEGAMFMARSAGEPGRHAEISRWLIEALVVDATR